MFNLIIELTREARKQKVMKDIADLSKALGNPIIDPSVERGNECAIIYSDNGVISRENVIFLSSGDKMLHFQKRETILLVQKCFTYMVVRRNK